MRWVALYGLTLWVVSVVQNVIHYTNHPIYKLRNSVRCNLSHIYTQEYLALLFSLFLPNFLRFLTFWKIKNKKKKKQANWITHRSISLSSFNLSNAMFKNVFILLTVLYYSVAIQLKLQIHKQKETQSYIHVHIRYKNKSRLVLATNSI